ncbi:hypothetical protein [Meiothermus sp.]|uniref:hypothetical protein n=1 Tax=Meiothermus sp. TaxID=1955249 RepID=UPI0021DD8008|nr:hypothetical protein [Meiothermus sp.]GIW32862.1 MAG: hypothetical protein KatS3mg072_0195 [Meiothermus sp.]
MLNLLAGAQNLNVNDLLDALAELRASASKISCIEERLEAIQRILAYEHGMPSKGLPADYRQNLPLIVQIKSGGRVDLASALGKPATRGHIWNMNDPVDVYFENQGKRVGPYSLRGGDKLEISFAIEALELEFLPPEYYLDTPNPLVQILAH